MAVGMDNTRGGRLRLVAPGWMDEIFGTGVVGELQIGESLINDLVRAIDGAPVTRGFGLQIGVVGRAKHMEQPIRATKFVRGPDMHHNTSVVIYIGPALSQPPIAPDVSTTHKMIADLFSTTLTCSLAVCGWIGTVGSSAAIGATGGAAAVATVYFANAAALSTVQCLGGVVHSSQVLTGNSSKAAAMDNDPGWQKFDRFADFVNLCALVYVGRDILFLKRALDGAGIKFTSAMTGEFDAGGALTMSRLMKLLKDVDDPSEIAREVRTRAFNAVLLGLGVYGSSRDSSGGYTAVKNIVVGKPEGVCPAPPGPGGVPSQAAAGVVGLAVQVGLPGPTSPSGSFVAPRFVADMLGFKPNEVATISVALLRTKA